MLKFVGFKTKQKEKNPIMYTFADTCLENKEKIVFHFSLFYFR